PPGPPDRRRSPPPGTGHRGSWAALRAQVRDPPNASFFKYYLRCRRSAVTWRTSGLPDWPATARPAVARAAATIGQVSSTVIARADNAVAGLTPGDFALVMATGILSIGAELEGVTGLSSVLLGLCSVVCVLLPALSAPRLRRRRDGIAEAFLDPARAFGFFTYVAGTNVLGVLLFMSGYHTFTAVFLALTLLAWF